MDLVVAERDCEITALPAVYLLMGLRVLSLGL